MRDNTLSKNYKKMDTIIFSLSMLTLLLLLDGGLKGNSIIALLIILVGYFVLKRKIRISHGKMNILVMFYLAYSFIITLLNHNTTSFFTENVKHVLLNFLIYLFVLIIASNIDAELYFKYIRNTSIVLSVFGLIEVITRFPVLHYLLFKSDLQYFSSSIGTADYRAVLLFIHPIIFGLFFLFFWIILLYIPFKKFYVNVFAHSLILINIIGSKSRSSWIALLIILAIEMYNKRNYIIKNKIKKKTFYRTFSVLVITISANAILGNPLADIINNINSRIQGSLEAGEGQIIRIENMINSIKYWFNGHELTFIFGNGLGFGTVFMKMFPIRKFDSFVWDSAIDNQYFTLIHETGIIGLIFILLILKLSIKRLMSHNQSTVGRIANLSLIAFYTTMFFYESFAFYLCFFIFCTLVCISDIFNNQVD